MALCREGLLRQARTCFTSSLVAFFETILRIMRILQGYVCSVRWYRLSPPIPTGNQTSENSGYLSLQGGAMGLQPPSSIYRDIQQNPRTTVVYSATSLRTSGTITGWWLIWKIMDFVSWDDSIPNFSWKVIQNSMVLTNQWLWKPWLTIINPHYPIHFTMVPVTTKQITAILHPQPSPSFEAAACFQHLGFRQLATCIPGLLPWCGQLATNPNRGLYQVGSPWFFQWDK